MTSNTALVTPAPAKDVESRYGLAWYSNAPAAFAEARRSGKLILADLWAPWCHTCLSMQNFVLTAANLPRASERFVFLAIDTELPENAAFLEKFPVDVWPTFYAIDADSNLLGRWLGAAAPAQFGRFLADSARIAELSQPAGAPGDDPHAWIREGDRHATQGRFREAAAAYAAALARAPADFPRRADTLVARIAALNDAQELAACLELARTEMTHTGSSASAVDFAASALDCAERSTNDPHAPEVRASVVARMTPLCEQGSAELSPDDRADACHRLQQAYKALGDAARAREATLRRLAVIERAAQGLPDEVALTYDWARVDSLLALERAEEALALSVARERALPSNYNPPAYQARIHKTLGRWSAGLAAVERALALAYGPRRIGLLTLKADLLLGAGNATAARAVVEAQLAAYRALPAGQKQPAAEARVERRLREWR